VRIVQVEGLARVGLKEPLILQNERLEVGLEVLVVAVEHDLMIPVDYASVNDRHFVNIINLIITKLAFSSLGQAGG
jgi:hypothetical protein